MKVCPKCEWVEIEDNIEFCPHCIFKAKMKQIDDTDKNEIEAYIELYEFQRDIYKTLGEELDNSYVPSTDAEVAQREREYREAHSNVPRCPTCSSTQLSKITATSKVVNTALFGIFGTKRHKTFHCNNCGYEW